MKNLFKIYKEYNSFLIGLILFILFGFIIGFIIGFIYHKFLYGGIL